MQNHYMYNCYVHPYGYTGMPMGRVEQMSPSSIEPPVPVPALEQPVYMPSLAAQETTGAQPMMCPKYGSGGQNAVAIIRGGPLAPQIRGYVYFMDVPGGTVVYVNVTGLPQYRPASEGKQPVGPHGFHIHEYGNCQEGSKDDPFMEAGQHWNPGNQPHGNHAGDFPVLFSNSGMAVMSFFTDKFKPVDVIGKSVIIHENPDDYRTQPAGNAGKRLACGVIRRANQAW